MSNNYDPLPHLIFINTFLIATIFKLSHKNKRECDYNKQMLVQYVHFFCTLYTIYN